MTVGSSGSQRVLDPLERVSEVIFGLIMVLSFTCSISAASAGQEEVSEMIVGAIGCNIAWGVVDAIMYLVSLLVERGRSLAVARSIRAAADPAHGRKLVAQSLAEPLGGLFEDAALESARAKLASLPSLPARPRLTGRDWRGALGIFLLVFLSTFPVVVPFLFVEPLLLATRVSNGVAIAMLFLSGYLLGRHAGLRPVRTALVMVAVGSVLVAITIALGG